MASSIGCLFWFCLFVFVVLSLLFSEQKKKDQEQTIEMRMSEKRVKSNLESTLVAHASGTESEPSEGNEKMCVCLNNGGLRAELQGQCKKKCTKQIRFKVLLKSQKTAEFITLDCETFRRS